MKLNEGDFSSGTAIIHFLDKLYQKINFKSHLNSVLLYQKINLKSHLNSVLLYQKINFKSHLNSVLLCK